MPRMVKIGPAVVNPGGLGAALATAGLSPQSITWAGYHDGGTPFQLASNATAVVATQMTVNGVTTTVTAQPGEIWLEYAADPGAPLDAVLAAHNPAALTPEQTRNVQDDTDLSTLSTNFQQWGALTSAQKLAALQVLVRQVIRRFRGDAI